MTAPSAPEGPRRVTNAPHSSGRPTVGILYAPGTNSHHETAHVFERVGAEPRFVFLSEVVEGTDRLDGFDVFCFPGGFAHGDHLGAGTLAGLMLRERLADQLAVVASRPLIAICNGFQVAMAAGLFGTGVTLTVNQVGTFRNLQHQPHMVADDATSPWLTGLAGQTIRFPCAHGEGRLVTDTPKGDGWRPELFYPPGENPDGSAFDIAGITSPDGLVFGLMDHPERAPDTDAAVQIFANGVAAAR